MFEMPTVHPARKVKQAVNDMAFLLGSIFFLDLRRERITRAESIDLGVIWIDMIKFIALMWSLNEREERGKRALDLILRNFHS